MSATFKISAMPYIEPDQSEPLQISAVFLGDIAFVLSCQKKF